MQTRIGVSICDLLEMDFFSNATVICGKGGLDRHVTQVNVMEVPDIVNWIMPGEFLLTTAYSIKDDISQLNKLIPEMKEVGVAGLGIKTKRYVDGLPQSVVDTANQLDFPIVQIPVDMSFGEIISNVLTHVVSKQTKLLVKIDEINNQLKAIMLRGGELSEMAGVIKEIVKAPVAIIDDIFSVYAIASDEEVEDEFIDIIENKMLNQTDQEFDDAFALKTTFEIDIIRENSIRRMIVPIHAHDMAYGRIVAWDLEDSIDDTTRFIIEAATSLIALNSSKKLSVYENENKHKIEFIEELLSSQKNYRLRAIEKASYFGFKIDRAYCVMIAAVSELSGSEHMKQTSSKLISVVERFSRQSKTKMIYGNKSDRVIFLLQKDSLFTPLTAKKRIYQLGSDLLRYARMENIHENISIGLGRFYDDYKNLHKSYGEAMKTIQKIELNKDSDRIIHFDELGIFRILSSEEVQPELKQFFVEVLGPVVSYDREKNANLLNTLIKYYECSCNLKKVSEEMFTHYNTVIYRIQRIREIGDLDFGDPNVSLNIQVALKILEVIDLESIHSLMDEEMYS